MGLLAKLKNMFNKNIDCSKELEGVFFHAILMSRPINIGSNIIVKEGYQALFVCKNKVMDILEAGKHKLDNSTIPYTFRRLKLYKISKHGNMPKKFKCDIYFISKEKISNFEFSSSQPYISKSKIFGKVFANCEGMCNFVIDQPKKLIEYLLLELAYVKNERAKTEISNIIGNAINEVLEKCPLNFESILTEVEDVGLYINTNINKKLEFCGLSCDMVKMNSMRVPAKLQKKIDEYLQMQKEYKDQFLESAQFQLNEVFKTLEMGENPNIKKKDPAQEEKIPAYLNREELARYPKKQCLFCGEYINQKAKYCEFCGFDQDMNGK